MNTSLPYDRYQRQLILKGFGVAAQDKLRGSKVLVIGAGGLGCPILNYLTAAGVGHLGVADHDKVSLSNLHRQILFDTNDIGKYKVDVVKGKLNALNPEVEIQTWRDQWTKQHCIDYFLEFDVIVDATDNFSSRYMINDASVLLQKPLVFGAVSQYEGQVAVFNVKQDDGSFSVSYRDIFPVPPQDAEVLNCSEAGVLGVLPGVIGSMQASEVIKLITGIGNPLVNKLWNYNVLNQSVCIMDLVPRKDNSGGMPLNLDQFLDTPYDVQCGLNVDHQNEINPDTWKESYMGNFLVDIREPYEQPRLNSLAESMNLKLIEIPLSELESRFAEVCDKNLVLVCQAGKRSLHAVDLLSRMNINSVAYSLKGGVNGLVDLKWLSNE
ncbi:MAG: hypothetical protein RL131_273 [Bacteroidota bacterium]